MEKLAVVILAAGKGKRLNSKYPKVLHQLCGKPMIDYSLGIANSLKPSKIIIVAGYEFKQVKDYLTRLKNKKIEITKQKQLTGSATAVYSAKRFLNDFDGDVLILYGDTPLIELSNIKKLIKSHRKNKNFITILSAVVDDASGYGRIIRDKDNLVLGIREDDNCNDREKLINEINVGPICIDKKELFNTLPKIKRSGKKKEFYLTGLVDLVAGKNKKVNAVIIRDYHQGLGVNSKTELSAAENFLKNKAINKLLKQGITIIDPNTTYISPDVKIGQDSIVYPCTVIEGKSRIGKDCRIGPFCRIRGDSIIGNNTQINNFVEIVRSKIGNNVNIKHHTYVGDTVIKDSVNIGAGTVVANYDGHLKSKTVIERNAFIGSGTILVAPVKVGKYAVTGAGSVVTKGKNIPAGAVVMGVPAKIQPK